MVNWFEKTREILQNQLNEKNDRFTILMEDFFDVLMVNINFMYYYILKANYAVGSSFCEQKYLQLVLH